MSRRVYIKSYPKIGIAKMIDCADEKILVEVYDPEIDQELSLKEFAEKLGYVLVEETEYERQQ